jgi:hypothetical protein
MFKPHSVERGLVVFPDDTPERVLPTAVFACGSQKRALVLDGRRLVRLSQDDAGVYRDWQIGDGLHQEDQQDADTIVLLQLFQRMQERQ